MHKLHDIVIRFRDSKEMKEKLDKEASKKRYPTCSYFLRELIRKFYKDMPPRD